MDPRLKSRLRRQITSRREELAGLSAVYSPAALAAVKSNPDDAAARIAFSREQVLALVDEPQAVESERPLPLALLEMLSGAADVHASPSSSAGSDRLAREATAAEGGGAGE